ncbi:MAG: S-methyl-5-thioribose-1-phosphate isomerase [Bdellovibrionales bacterium]|nr:S-methyl-5-thioribose-1-phosphate isomerase [Bdellovibrionales bacterium]
MKNFECMALRYHGQYLELLDQTRLPVEEHWLKIQTVDDMYEAIHSLRVRGAPLIGVSAAVFLALYAESGITENDFLKATERLRVARPTAVNLMYAIDEIKKIVHQSFEPQSITQVAEAILDADKTLCQKIGEVGAEYIQDGMGILTHCNTGGLATAGRGTALGVIQTAFEQGKKIHVYVDETRPLLQGGRLTTWELGKLGIPYTLICDNMAAALMRDGKIQCAIVGADRIAMNGDFANKTGTYGVAVACFHHNVPFYTAAPVTTLDFDCDNGLEIPIEERTGEEVQGVRGAFGKVLWAPENAKVYNPAFDITSAELVTGWILDTGFYSQSDVEDGALRRLQNK